jgi:hypothetical protein
MTMMNCANRWLLEPGRWSCGEATHCVRVERFVEGEWAWESERWLCPTCTKQFAICDTPSVAVRVTYLSSAAVGRGLSVMMRDLSPEQRLQLFVGYCRECGGESPDGKPCQCWNDE